LRKEEKCLVENIILLKVKGNALTVGGQMNKRNWYYKWADWETMQGIGSTWISKITQYFPIGTWLQESSIYYIGLVGLKASHLIIWGLPVYLVGNIPIWMVFFWFMGKFYFVMFEKWLVAKYVIRIKLYEAQQQYGAKKEHLSPVQVEVFSQYKEYTKVLNAIAKKVDIEERVENKITSL
jgi:hypothetical protein